MSVQQDYPSAQGSDRAVTLRDLIDLVTAAQRLDLDPDRVIVRGQGIAFRTQDLGVPEGSVMRTLGLTEWPPDLDPTARRGGLPTGRRPRR